MDKLDALKIFLLAIGILFAAPALAYVMSSTSYRIERDSVNLGGGLGTSTSYKLEGTAGEAGSGYSTSTSYKVSAGYQQLDATGYITLTIPSSAALSPALNSLVGGQSVADAQVSVITTNYLGYSLDVKASTSPAMRSSSSTISDYTTASSDPDYSWSVSSTAAEFGFSASSTDLAARYRNNGAACNQPGGAYSLGACWDSFTTSYRTVSQSSSSNEPNGTATALRLQAEIGSSAMTVPGSYSASIIITAYTN